jgi:predicted RNA-binding Zn ribbon-like protein
VLERPLTGEPLALDLVNTRWINRAEVFDVLDDGDATRAWFAEIGHPDAVIDASAIAALREARDAVLEVVSSPGTGAAADALNAVLRHGRVRLRLGSDSPEEVIDLSEPGWQIAWLAARNLLELLATSPDRIHKCSNHDCVLWFYDTTKNGRRRWCSMEGCGNRAKAARYRRRSPG